MRVFRIEREKYLESTLLGIGSAMNTGSRWNSMYTHMVYTAESRALAILEVAVHLDMQQDLPQDRHFVEIEIPDDLKILELTAEDLPDEWDAKPPIRITQKIGDAFVKMRDAAVLKVPSSIVNPESNYLINPHHPASSRIKVISTSRLQFDNRLVKSK